MIAKRIEKKQPGKFRPLAEYIAGAKEEGEKLEDFWIVNAHSGDSLDDLDIAITVIDATQALNTRVKTNKSYHLIVSFRDEKPSLDALKDIEKEFARALGFEDHQRIAGTHSNTDNFHMHIGFSRIHPVTFKAHTPSNDFYALERVCRDMEQKYGLKIDNGIDQEKQKAPEGRKPTSAEDMERHTWEKSFYTYVIENKDQLDIDLSETRSWADLHKHLADRFGIQFRKRGNGLVIANMTGKETIKASSIDRQYSKKALEDRFGPFERPQNRGIHEGITTPKNTHELKDSIEARKGAKRYSPGPLFKAPKQSALWRKYIGLRQKDETLVGKAFRSWKQFLQADALDDVYAMTIINFYNRTFQDIAKVGQSKDRSR